MSDNFFKRSKKALTSLFAAVVLGLSSGTENAHADLQRKGSATAKSNLKETIVKSQVNQKTSDIKEDQIQTSVEKKISELKETYILKDKEKRTEIEDAMGISEDVKAKIDLETNMNAEKLGDVLHDLSKSEIGKDLILRVPSDVRFCFMSEKQLRSQGVAAGYSPKENAIVIADPPSDKTSPQYLRLLLETAHETRHAIQHAMGLDDINSPYHSLNYAASKLCELDTRVHDDIFASDLYKDCPDQKGPGTRFYEAELGRLEKLGFSSQDAKTEAKTNLCRLYWSNGHDVPEGCSEITDDFRNEILGWNFGYDMQTLKNQAKENGKYNFLPFVTDSMSENVKEQELKEAMFETYVTAKSSDPEKLKSLGLSDAELKQAQKTFSIVSTYAKIMGVNLSGDYFTRIQRENADVGDSFIKTEDSQIVAGPNGSTFSTIMGEKRENNEQRGFKFIVRDSRGRYVNTMTKDEDGRSLHIPYKEGFRDGLAYVTDASGKCQKIFECKKGKVGSYTAEIDYGESNHVNQIKILTKNDNLKCISHCDKPYKCVDVFTDNKCYSVRFNSNGDIDQIQKAQKDENGNYIPGNIYKYNNGKGYPEEYRTNDSKEWKTLSDSDLVLNPEHEGALTYAMTVGMEMNGYGSYSPFLSDVTDFLKTRGDIKQKTTNALPIALTQKDR